MTIRRDLAQLDHEQLLRLAPGGATAFGLAVGGVDFQIRGQRHLAAKREIAAVAAGMLNAPAMIGLDAGTTTLEVVHRLPPGLDLTVVTQSLPAMVALSTREHTEVVGLGGMLHRETQAFAGPGTIAGLSDVRIEILFLAASGVRGGTMYCGNPFDAETKRAMIAASERVVLLADSSKFLRPAAFMVGPLSTVDACVVDAGIDGSSLADLRGLGIEVVIAPRARDDKRSQGVLHRDGDGR
jgi:DeoR family fructose operon transcriptional repressor